MIAFASSMMVHVVSFFGVSLFEQFAVLHLGIFALAIPAVFSAKNRRVGKATLRPGEAVRILLSDGPAWGGRALLIGWLYGLVSMVVLFLMSQGGTAGLPLFVVWYWVPRGQGQEPSRSLPQG